MPFAPPQTVCKTAQRVQRTQHALALALHAEDEGKAPLWVHVLPAGRFEGRDGRGPYVFDDAQAALVLQAFTRHGADLPVDYEHQSLEAAQAQGPVPAAGWIEALESRADGLWARVAWTAQAAELLVQRAYRYLSPVFDYLPDGRVIALAGAALTHVPNLRLQAAASQGDSPMDELLERLRYLLNLPTLATPAEVLAELDRLKARMTAAETAAQSAQAALQAAHAAAAQPDPARFVPVDMHRRVADELARLQAQQAAHRAVVAVDAAMVAGKLAPAMKDWATAYAERDIEGFETFVAAAPVVVAAGANDGAALAAQAAHARRGAPLSDEELTAARLLGLSNEAFAAARG